MGIVKDILTEAKNKDIAEDDLKWFKERAMKVKGLAITPKAFIEDLKEYRVAKPRIGRIVSYLYIPITDNLPVFDVFPLTLVLEESATGFIGLNFHYLPPRERQQLFEALVTRQQGERIRVTPEQLARAKMFRPYSPTIHNYRFNQIRSKIIQIPENLWESILFLPTARFRKGSKRSVWTNSRKIIKRGAAL